MGDSAVLHKTAASQRLAVVIPYRDREEHLKVMLPATQKCLQRSKISGAVSPRLSNADATGRFLYYTLLGWRHY